MKNRILLIIPALFAAASGCTDSALFDQLESSTVSVVLKGTFESNSPRAWDMSSATVAGLNDDSISIVSADSAFDSRKAAADAVNTALDSAFTSYNQYPTEFCFDVAKMKANGENFAVTRKVYRCAVSDTDDFFNGNGVGYPCDDVERGKRYTNLQMYIRKIVINGSNEYKVTDDSAEYVRTPYTTFDEKKLFGSDIIQQCEWAFWDILRDEMYDINRVFPLSMPIVDGGTSGVSGFKSDATRKAVLEVRFVVKNYLKRYEVMKTDDLLDNYGSFHIFGFSDWLRDVRPYRSGWLGGNIIASARAYYPDSVGTITGAVAAPAGAIVIAIPEEQALDPNLDEGKSLDENDYATGYFYQKTYVQDIAKTLREVTKPKVKGLDGFYEYANRNNIVRNVTIDNLTNKTVLDSSWEDIKDSYGVRAASPSLYDTESGLSISQADYYLELERWNEEYYNEYYGSVMNCDPDGTNSFTVTNSISGSTVDYDDYAAVWDRYNSLIDNFRLPPLATSVDAGGNYTLTNVPVGRAYRLYVSTQGTGSAAAPSAAELPYGWKARGSNIPVSVSDPGSSVTANF